MSPRHRTDHLPHVPALDGLRGVAVAGVLLFHAGYGWAAGGFLGVSTFFTLSGFLITSLLLLERERTGRVGLRAFWARRARRLLPAALLTLAGVALYGALVADPHQLERLQGDALSALGYVANWRFVVGDRSYAALFSQPSPVQHFWSLAIEEQCYLVVPLVVAGVLAIGHGSRRVLGAVLGMLAAGSAVLATLLFHPGTDPSRVYYGTDTRAVELLVGAILAVAIAGRFPFRREASRRIAGGSGLVALGLLVLAWFALGQNDTFLYRGGLPLHALLAACVITAAVQPSVLGALLALRPLPDLGRISYGVYLFHWPIFLWLSPERTGLDRTPLFAVRLLVTVALATLSLRYVEAPIRAARWTWTRTRRGLPVVATAVAAAAVALVLVGDVATPPRLTFAAVSRTAPRAGPPPVAAPAASPRAVAAGRLPDTGDPGATLVTAPGDVPRAVSATSAPPPLPVRRVMVVGDSVAATLGRGLERWGAHHGVAVWNVATKWCGIARGGQRALMKVQDNGAACDGWAPRWSSQLDRFHPDVVVVLTTIWDVIDRRRAEWGGQFRRPGDAEFDRWMVSELGAAADLLSTRGARVVWLAAPCAADASFSDRLRYLDRRYLTQVVAPRPDRVRVVDLFARLCPDGKFEDRIDDVADGRPDGLHFSDPGADRVAAWLGPQLSQRVERAPRVHLR